MGIKLDEETGLYYGAGVTSDDLEFADYRVRRMKEKVEKVVVTTSDDNSITLHVETKDYLFDQKIFRSEFWEGFQ